MHRVELKALSPQELKQTTSKRFLMHRVELKVLALSATLPEEEEVPNAPCGVERLWSGN
jgi:hypothetical protein